MSEEEPLKVILLGNTGVGKSNLITRFHSNEFCEDFESTVGVEFVTKRMEVDGVPVKLQIWDTAGQERYASMMKTYYRKAKGSLLVFDVTNRGSFQGLEATLPGKWSQELLDSLSKFPTWRKHLEANADPRCVSVVTGNKSDMEAHEISFEEASSYAKERNMTFMQTSAKTGENVEEAFVTLARLILQAGQGRPGLAGSRSMRLQGNKQSSSTSAQDCC